MRIPFISLAAAGALALGGCAYGDVGLGLGYGGYGDYGYGYGSPYYGYGYGPYGGYGAYPGYYGGFGYPFGWYGDYYYPGTGIYVYDSYRRPRLWNEGERTYWTSRQRVATTTGTRTTTVSPNWTAFSRQPQLQAREERQQQRLEAREERPQQRLQAREERQQQRLQTRVERQQRRHD